MTDEVTLNFVVLEESGPACVIVRSGKGSVALAVSLSSNGDIEVFMPKDATRELARALAKAAE